MAKKKRKGRVPPHLRKYLFKKGHGAKKRRRARKHGKKRRARRAVAVHNHKAGHHMAKRKRRHSKRRRHHARGRRSHGGGGRSITGRLMSDIPTILAGAAIGFAEKSIAANDGIGQALASLPAPVDALGRVGNLALLAYAGSWLVGGSIGHYLGMGAKVAATVTMRDIVKRGKVFASATELSGPGDGNEQFLHGDDIGALAEEVGRRFNLTAQLETGDEPLPHQADNHVDEHEALIANP